ncbi:hypothetical protein N1851_025745 [Merluccius polli]|uniref:Integrase zinc-binding domain-containing protein n=1 Tax=Merluccius polli TaxID=89951 RepID=A0AA47NTM8_MERPO|nr:hypothetical protein N1851_025745 [Merluccius polli]
MRCLKPLDFGEVTTAQLHHFCDASEDGYGAVAYLLSRNAQSQVHSAFVMGKARVAPLKPVTIPQIELIAATMASKKKAATVNAVQASEEADAVTRMTHHFSSWVHLRKAVAWILRFKTWLSSLCQKRRQQNRALAQSDMDVEQQRCSLEKDMETFKRKMASSCPSVEELEKSELEIIKFSQRKRFPEEFSMLEKGKSVKGHSHIHTLCPLMEDGVLRVGGRLSRSSMPAEAKHPIILAKHLHISTLLLRHVHQKVGHGGRNHMLSKLRERYWILGASTAIRNEPPFTRVGVDYFGPFEVKSRRSVVKRYGVIFTCMAIRGIHIEVAPSLDTDAFINALRRFIARRGQKGIKWSFNPPAGSHHGGSWERLIRSVRKVLKSTLNVQSLDEEGLHTVLCEVEAIINGRPITKASMDPYDLEALTPNHLLLLKALPSLPPGVFQEADIYAHRRWKQVQYMSDLFWKR